MKSLRPPSLPTPMWASVSPWFLTACLQAPPFMFSVAVDGTKAELPASRCASELYPKLQPDCLVFSEACSHWRCPVGSASFWSFTQELLGSLSSHPMWLVPPLPCPSHWLSRPWLHSHWRSKWWQCLKLYLVCALGLAPIPTIYHCNGLGQQHVMIK